MKKRELLTITRLIELCEEEIEDPRREGYNQQHKLVDILVIVLLAAISGCDDWLGVEDYGIAKEKWLRTFLELPNGMPSDDTYRRVFERIDPKQLERVYREWVMPYIGGCCGKQIAIDGKTICAASNAQENRHKSKIHILSVHGYEKTVFRWDKSGLVKRAMRFEQFPNCWTVWTYMGAR